MIRISVIVPVYNGEKYLRKCLDSIANQTIDGLEVIVVDNKSTDESPLIIEEFISCWSSKRRIIFLTEDRQGNAYARNTGTEHATGEYIAFIDQDDYIKSDYFEKLYNEANAYAADVVVSGYELVTPKGQTKRVVELKKSKWSPYRIVAPWGKIYKKSLIIENNIRFLPVNKGEDIYFVFNAYNHANIVYVSDYVGYRWLSNNESFSRTEHKKIDDNNSILPLFYALQNSLFPLKHVDSACLEYFYIKTIVHEVMFCAKGNNLEDVYGYYERLIKWIDKEYPNNESNYYLRLFGVRGEEYKRRFFVTLFWYMKKKRKIKLLLKMYANIFR